MANVTWFPYETAGFTQITNRDEIKKEMINHRLARHNFPFLERNVRKDF